MRSSNYLRQAKRRQNRPDSNTHISLRGGDDKVAGKETLAAVMNVSAITVEAWIMEGMPVEQIGDELHDWIFNLKDIKEWLASEGR